MPIDASRADAEPHFVVSDRMPIAGGRLNVVWDPKRLVADEHGELRYDILVHFHGAERVASEQLQQSELNVVMAVVNFTGLSSAYKTPFRKDAALFEKILASTANYLRRQPSVPTTAVERDIYVSSFSAGYGAVREILKSRDAFQRIDGYVAADSIYASIVDEALPERAVDPDQMRDFLRFAKAAAQGKKQFVLSHSAQATPYASTTETANYLVEHLDAEVVAVDGAATGSWRPISERRSGRFRVLGFGGELAEAHLRHLRSIGQLWQRLELGTPRPGSAKPLFNRTDLDGWYSWLRNERYEDPDQVFSVVDREIRITGASPGYLATQQQFKDYVLTAEFRWGETNVSSRIGKARDAGLFLHATGQDGNSADGHGAFMAAIECQIMEAAVGDLMLIRGRDEGSIIPLALTTNVGPSPDRDGWPFYQAAGNARTLETWGRLNRDGKRKDWSDTFGIVDTSKIEKPATDWNTLQCRCIGDTIVVSLNHQIVNAATNVQPSRGKILLQSEGSEIYFRKVSLSPCR